MRCPCLGLTSNELRELLFSCIKGAIRESFSISPPRGDIPSRHVHLPCDCPPSALAAPPDPGVGAKSRGVVTPDLKTQAEKDLGLGSCRARRQKRQNKRLMLRWLLQTCALSNVFLLPFLPPASSTLHPSPTQLSSFCSSVTLGFAHLHFFLERLYPGSLVKRKREKERD